MGAEPCGPSPRRPDKRTRCSTSNMGVARGEPFVRGVRYTFVTPLLDTPRYRHAFVCLGVRHLTGGRSPARPPPSSRRPSLVVVRPRECSRRSCPTPAPRPSAPPRAPRRPARARGMTRGPRPRSGSRCRCRDSGRAQWGRDGGCPARRFVPLPARADRDRCVPQTLCRGADPGRVFTND